MRAVILKRCAAALLMLLPFAAQAQPQRVGFGETDTLAHRLSGEDTAVVAGWVERYSHARVRVTIAPTGDVIDAKALPEEYLMVGDGEETRGYDYPEFDTASAVAAARRWKFRPFTYRGAPVTALGEVRIRVLPSEAIGEWNDPAAAFPAIDYRTLKITLARGYGGWGGPQYRVTIDGDGNVEFTTEPMADPPAGDDYWFLRRSGGGVVAPGTHRSRIDRRTLDALIARFQGVRFFGLKPRYYGLGVSDQPTQLVWFETGGHRFMLYDYAGDADGMPHAVTELENAIDEAAGTARWVNGDAETARLALAEGLDIHSEAARRMADRAAFHGEGQPAIDLIDAGLPLDMLIHTRADQRVIPLGASLLLDAIQSRRPRLFARLADLGWLARTPRDALDEAMNFEAAGCDAMMMRRLAASGVDVNVRVKPRRGRGDEDGTTALIRLLLSYGPCSERDPHDAVAAALAAGANPNLADAEGRPPLFHVERYDVLEQLLAARARADVRDRQGLSPVFSQYADALVRRLLEAGADPRGADEYHRSLRARAIEYEWPATLAWLDAHGIP